MRVVNQPSKGSGYYWGTGWNGNGNVLLPWRESVMERETEVVTLAGRAPHPAGAPLPLPLSLPLCLARQYLRTEGALGVCRMWSRESTRDARVQQLLVR